MLYAFYPVLWFHLLLLLQQWENGLGAEPRKIPGGQAQGNKASRENKSMSYQPLPTYPLSGFKLSKEELNEISSVIFAKLGGQLGHRQPPELGINPKPAGNNLRKKPFSSSKMIVFYCEVERSFGVKEPDPLSRRQIERNKRDQNGRHFVVQAIKRLVVDALGKDVVALWKLRAELKGYRIASRDIHTANFSVALPSSYAGYLSRGEGQPRVVLSIVRIPTLMRYEDGRAGWLNKFLVTLRFGVKFQRGGGKGAAAYMNILKKEGGPAERVAAKSKEAKVLSIPPPPNI